MVEWWSLMRALVDILAVASTQKYIVCISTNRISLISMHSNDFRKKFSQSFISTTSYYIICTYVCKVNVTKSPCWTLTIILSHIYFHRGWGKYQKIVFGKSGGRLLDDLKLAHWCKIILTTPSSAPNNICSVVQCSQ